MINNYEEIRIQNNFHDKVALKFENDIIICAYEDEKINPKSSCKHCLGRGFEGKVIDASGNVTGDVIPCRCILRKARDKSNDVREVDKRATAMTKMIENNVK